MATIHKNDVVVGAIYIVRLHGGNELPIQILKATTGDRATGRTNWIARNLKTNREVRIKSAAKLRKRITELTPLLERYGVQASLAPIDWTLFRKTVES